MKQVDHFQRIIDSIVAGEIRTPDQLQRAKHQACREYGLKELPTNSEILAVCPEEFRERVLPILRKKPTRTLSGVAVLAIMTEPSPCPHGKCSYCPGGVEFGTPQSYTGREPAALRAMEHDFDPYLQTVNRLEQLVAIGHSVDKVDVIIMGGTFTSFDPEYRSWFVQRCFDGLNGSTSRTLDEAHSMNESADARCIGLTIETRPDCFGEVEVSQSMALGVTRIELGVQSTNDEVLERVNRGHGTSETITATRVSKDNGMKVCYHMMPGLPGADIESDIASFNEIFTNEDYRPDMLKIYPTLVIENTQLYHLWKAGDFVPYHEKEVAELLAEVKGNMPEWVRIQRVQRDIPAPLIVDGVKKGDIRLLAQELLKERGGKCRCIRCREIGRIGVDSVSDNANIQLKRLEYEASGGMEVFLAFKDDKSGGLIAYCRLRESNGIARVRELKVLGEVVPINQEAGGRWQHQGLGKRLINECERIASDDWEFDLISVTSGVGARGYYRKMGYELDHPYMIKQLD
ncbi:MAG: tRNA uridine(34) 5-carboxymethylaminomethyl modification radical SAM/GNAT enzyme Elp3 [Thermoplasmata archaeon]